MQVGLALHTSVQLAIPQYGGILDYTRQPNARAVETNNRVWLRVPLQQLVSSPDCNLGYIPSESCETAMTSLFEYVSKFIADMLRTLAEMSSGDAMTACNGIKATAEDKTKHVSRP
jgi:hypothetical protein